jgi:uncharacterized surface protein with fasciclin (FAS1) repeats|tara:strand:- start:1210 stop:1551 length:342 start_codon:yes stop_codon:yes gene_type:complete
MCNLAAVTAATLTFGTAAQAANIVEIASGDDRFTTLVAAISAAGLVETLQGPGPLDVFAPLKDAFAASPAGTVETLLKPKRSAIVVISNIKADSDVIHAIDKVLLPGTRPDCH